MLFCWLLVAGLAVLLMQLLFDLYILLRIRGRTVPRAIDVKTPTDYRHRFLCTPPPSGIRRALYVSEETYQLYQKAARGVLGAKQPLYQLTDAILREHMERCDRALAELARKGRTQE